ncbi:MAG TPA: helix-turn-helix domain-containing protein [Nocardioides sp.]|nr:helix-turn-helix domain-containing protein [Nocardioides sp.]
MSELSAAEAFDGEYDGPPSPEPLGLAPDVVEVRRNGGLAALVGAVASGVGIAYLARATSTGSWLDWALFAVMGLLGVAHLLAFVDARTPLLVADSQGVRIRLGRSWRGMPWGALARVEHRPRRGVLRDGRLILVARNPERVLEELDAGGRRQSWIAERLYGAPFAVPLALSTRVSGAGDDLTGALTRLAGDTALVVEIAPQAEVIDADEVDEVSAEPDLFEPARIDEPTGSDDAADAADVSNLDDDLDPADAEDDEDPSEDPSEDPTDDHAQDDAPTGRRWRDPRPAVAHGIGALTARLQRRRAVDGDRAETHEVDEQAGALPMVASATPSPLRAPLSASRIEVRSDLTLGATALAARRDEEERSTRREMPEGRELRRPGSINLIEDTVVWGDRVRPIAREGNAVEPLVIDDFGVEPADDPIVGPELAAARTRLGLTVDQLADRTRIRPHVIESIEVDDFQPCGGDFYARGHLRTLARVLGIDVAPLLVAYDDRYADAPINPRRVFEAELATGSSGSIRGTRGGPNWSVLIAAVMTLVLAWSVARLVMDSPVALPSNTPVLNGSDGTNNTFELVGDPVPVVLKAVGGGAHIVVRDGSGQVAFTGNLSYGETRTLKSVAPPVRVQSSDGSLEVELDGEDQGALGAEGQPAQDTFTVR